jgi:hypothetical protein
MTEEKGFSIDIPLSSLDSRWHWAFQGILTALKGFSQWGQFKEGRNLGKKIRWEDLPREVRDHALRRHEGSEEK